MVAYRSKLAPYSHQEAALAKMRGRRVFALTMAMRTGKTKVLLDNFGMLEFAGEVKDLLVVAPAGVYRTWAGEVDKHVSDDLQARLDIYTWISAQSQLKAQVELQNQFLASTAPRILLLNVEALSTVKRAREFCEAFLRDPDMAMIAIDESTIIKSITAQRTKYIIKELKPRAFYRRILSGLPTPRSPLDLYAQFEFLDERILGFKSYYGFRNRYAVLKQQIIGGRTIQLVVGYQNVEELQHIIAPHSYRVEFRPNIPSTYSIREVALTDEQRRIYDEIKTYATSQLAAEAHVTATVVVAQILRLHQVLCGHVSDEGGNLHEVPENKTAQLLEILDDYHAKAVIWCSYDYNIRSVVAALRTEYGEHSVARFWGGNVDTREAEEREFKTNPACRFMVATPSAGGWGRTWSEADLVIYYSSNYNLEHREQSEQRVQGVTKQKQVDYIDLIAPGTVETKILNVLRKKLNMAATITGDAWREWLI